MCGTGTEKTEILKDFLLLELSEEEAKDFQTKLKLKGKQRYKELYNAVSAENNKQKFSYEILSQHYRYDIKLRRALYKIISFTEIAMRATIANNYEIKEIKQKNVEKELNKILENPIKINQAEEKKIAIAFQRKHKISLFELLESVDMQVLNKIFRNLSEKVITQVFSKNDKLKENLDSMRKLRNAVMHNNILITKKYGKVWIDGEEKTDLQSHIENAINLSPCVAKDDLKKLINSCLIIDEGREEEYKKQGKEAENRYQLLKKYKVYFEGV